MTKDKNPLIKPEAKTPNVRSEIRKGKNQEPKDKNQVNFKYEIRSITPARVGRNPNEPETIKLPNPKL